MLSESAREFLLGQQVPRDTIRRFTPLDTLTKRIESVTGEVTDEEFEIIADIGVDDGYPKHMRTVENFVKYSEQLARQFIDVISAQLAAPRYLPAMVNDWVAKLSLGLMDADERLAELTAMVEARIAKSGASAASARMTAEFLVYGYP